MIGLIRKNAFWTLVVLLALMLVVSTACTGTSTEPGSTSEETEEEQTGYRDTVVIGIAGDTDTFDNLKVTRTEGGHRQLYEALVGRDWDNNLADGLAESYEVSDDGLSITIKLKDGVKFHNGDPLTAEAVVEYFTLLTDPEVNSPSAGDFAWANNAEAVGEDTVVFHLEETRPYAIPTLSNGGGYGGVMNAEAWKEHGPWGDDTYGIQMAMGTGPFKLEEWIPGDKQVMVRNDDYDWAPSWAQHEGPAFTERLIYRVIPDAATRIAELEAGTIDILMNVPAEHVERIKNMDGVELLKNPSWRWGDVLFNTQAEPFDDVRVRQAVALAFDQEKIVETAWFGMAEPLYALVAPRFGEDSVENKQAFGYDPERAKQLLAEAGYENGFSTTLAVENRSEYVRVAEMVAEYLGDVGIEVEIMQMDTAAWNDHIASGDHELYIKQTGWFSLDILPWFFHSRQIPHPGHSRWDDPKTDDFFDRAESAPTMEERSAIYREAQKYLTEQMIWAPVWAEYDLAAIRDEVEGFRWHPWYSYSRMYNVRVRED